MGMSLEWHLSRKTNFIVRLQTLATGDGQRAAARAAVTAREPRRTAVAAERRGQGPDCLHIDN
jgi:hypothetical protein